MLIKVFENIEKYQLIKEKDNILLGLSGGHDSMSLLYCLLKYREKLDYNLILCHVNHGVRGEDADSDQDFVRNLSEKLGLDFHTKNVDMVAYGKEMGISAEEAGRILRYGFFRQILEEYGGGKIAVAHNQDDQVETVLMRIIRGTGVDGLKSMYFKQDDIIRPILNISRIEIEEYVEENNIPVVLDKTNAMPIYTRNKLRLELIPYIEENFNPRLKESIFRLSMLAREDVDFINKLALEKYKDMAVEIGKNRVVIKRSKYISEDNTIKSRVLRLGIERILGSLNGISESHIVLIDELIKKGQSGKSLNIYEDLVVRNVYGEVFIERSREIEGFQMELKLGEDLFIESLGYLIKTRVINKMDYKNSKGKNLKFIDLDKVSGSIEVRNRRPGDIFVPFGMKGRKKLKDYFIDKKIARDLRDETPLMVDEENIVYVMGFDINNNYRVENESENILEISFEKIRR